MPGLSETRRRVATLRERVARDQRGRRGQDHPRVDTGFDRFLLQQILPGDGAWAFVGTAPPVPNVLSEPFVVLVDVGTGAPTRHSLWR